ncbi:hypothetical protein ACJ41O_003623 [Fusarium nematophilum]
MSSIDGNRINQLIAKDHRTPEEEAWLQKQIRNPAIQRHASTTVSSRTRLSDQTNTLLREFYSMDIQNRCTAYAEMDRSRDQWRSRGRTANYCLRVQNGRDQRHDQSSRSADHYPPGHYTPIRYQAAGRHQSAQRERQCATPGGLGKHRHRHPIRAGQGL